MVLTVNIGNTNSSIGLFDTRKLMGTTGFSTASLPDDETIVGVLLESFIQQFNISIEQINGLAISSVVPALTRRWTAIGEKLLKVRTVVVSGTLPLGIRINYDDPATLGADRVCSCVGAFELYGGPAIVADFGTASTYNMIDAEGNFIGGAIAPGIITAAQDLFRKTAQLPNVGLRPPSRFPGSSTLTSMEAGIFYAGIDAAEGMIRRMLDVSGPGTHVVATGGLGGMVASHTRLIEIVNRNLVLEGAKMIFSRLRPKRT